jgi:hypothetical protein
MALWNIGKSYWSGAHGSKYAPVGGLLAGCLLSIWFLIFSDGGAHSNPRIPIVITTRLGSLGCRVPLLMVGPTEFASIAFTRAWHPGSGFGTSASPFAWSTYTSVNRASSIDIDFQTSGVQPAPEGAGSPRACIICPASNSESVSGKRRIKKSVFGNALVASAIDFISMNRWAVYSRILDSCFWAKETFFPTASASLLARPAFPWASPASFPTITNESTAMPAAADAPSAEFLASRAFELASLISWSAMDCRWLENRDTPASPANSPKRLMATIQTNTSLGFLDHLIQIGSLSCSSRYSPAAPYASTKPQTRSIHSDASRQCSVAPLDKERKYPISPYRLLGACGILLTGLATSSIYLLSKMCHNRSRRSE